MRFYPQKGYGHQQWWAQETVVGFRSAPTMLQTANHCRTPHPPRPRRVTGNTPATLLLLFTPQLRCAVEDVDVQLRQPSTLLQQSVMEEHQHVAKEAEGYGDANQCKGNCFCHARNRGGTVAQQLWHEPIPQSDHLSN